MKISDLNNEVWSQKQKRMLEDGDHFKGSDGQLPHVVGHDWYRGEHLNMFPFKPSLQTSNAIYDYFLKGFVPEAPFIKQTDYVTAFGSCFAHYLRIHLLESGYKTYDISSKFVPIVHIPEGINNTFALRQQFDWAWGNKSISDGLWVDRDKVKYSPTEEARQATKEIFDNTDVFILTLGLSEVWYDKQTEEVFWRGVPINRYDPDQHGFKVSTVEENFNNLETIYLSIKKNRPDANIIITLSPVPLIATFRDIPCTAANIVSKSILRVAVDLLHQKYKSDPKFWYWPSYELVKELWNTYDDDNRHICRETIDRILSNFDQYYLIK